MRQSVYFLYRESSPKVLAAYSRIGDVVYNQYEATVIVTGLHTLATDRIVHANLRYIVSNTTGLGHINDKLDSKIIFLENTSDIKGVTSTAEHTFGLILGLARGIKKPILRWDRGIPGHKLFGKTIGIYGYGRIGHQVEQIAAGLGMKSVPYDVSMDPSVEYECLSCDIVTLHVRMPTPEVVFGRKQLLTMKNGAWFVNTSRGEYVDEASLLALSGKFSGIALDVLRGEPTPPNLNNFQNLENCVITPHLGGWTNEDLEMTSLYCAAKLEEQIAHDEIAMAATQR